MQIKRLCLWIIGGRRFQRRDIRSVPKLRLAIGAQHVPIVGQREPLIDLLITSVCSNGSFEDTVGLIDWQRLGESGNRVFQFGAVPPVLHPEFFEPFDLAETVQVELKQMIKSTLTADFQHVKKLFSVIWLTRHEPPSWARNSSSSCPFQPTPGPFPRCFCSAQRPQSFLFRREGHK